ncbi:hypothetical protein LJC19_08165 [Oxalobacter sp. OttesenSCG-928-P03]|nr:hypothetical protein [Oxalobacter sp. OttesenSCG-928-P03]
MLPGVINDTAISAREKYQAFLDTVQGAVLNRVNSTDWADARTLWSMALYLGQLNPQGRILYEDLRLACSNAVAAIRDIALEIKADLSEEERRVLDGLGASAIGEINQILLNCFTRDSESGYQVLRKYAITADMILSAKGNNKSQALILAKRQILNHHKFTQSDRAGRQWGSAHFVYVAIRMKLLDLYIDTLSYIYAKTGNDLVVVTFSNDKKEVFSLSGVTPGYRSLVEERKHVFHPRSEAYFEPVR